jgi:hypothetical protein
MDYIDIPRTRVGGKKVSAFSIAVSVEMSNMAYRNASVIAPPLVNLRQAYMASEAFRESMRGGETVRAAIGPGPVRMPSLKHGEIAVTYVVPHYWELTQYGWHAKGRAKTKLLPPNGFQAALGNRLWDEDGFPLRTCMRKDEAVESFVQAGIPEDTAAYLASPFYRRDSYEYFMGVARVSEGNDSPWCIKAFMEPDGADGADGAIGFRSIILNSGSMPRRGQLANHGMGIQTQI